MASDLQSDDRQTASADSPDTGGSARTGPRILGALAGLIAAAVAVGAAELVAGALGITSIIVSVGEQVIALAPAAVASAAIELIGGLNRPALITGTLVFLALISLGIGLLTLRRFTYGAIGVAGLGVVGMAASAANPVDSLPLALLPGLAAAAAGVAALWALNPQRHATHETATDPDPDPATADPDPDPETATDPDQPPRATDRRAFLVLAGALTVSAAAMAAGGRWLQDRAGAAAERIGLTLPSPARPADPLPQGVDLGVDGLVPFVTPNEDFYRIDTAVQIPEILAEDWQLRIHGMVANELTLDYQQLQERYEVEEHDITLTCVSNVVGGDLVGNARWLGVRLVDVLEDAGVDPDATQLVGRSVDGYTGGFPVADAMDGRDALIVIGMNGEPLPAVHGYPVRLVVPGLYGYVSAVKWLAELELTTFEAFDQYWVERQWAEEAPIKVQSRIDVPRPLIEVAAGEVVLAGVAWAQGRGIDLVEVQIDGGEWQPADLGEVPNVDTWRQWTLTTQLEPGNVQIRVRATDGDGTRQDEERVDPIPDGAEGWHSLQVRVG